MDNAARWISIGSISLVTLSLLYVAGYFQPIGSIWLQQLSIQDVFSLSWTILPSLYLTILLCILANFLIQKTTNRAYSKDLRLVGYFAILIVSASIVTYIYCIIRQTEDETNLSKVYAFVGSSIVVSSVLYYGSIYRIKKDLMFSCIVLTVGFSFSAIPIGASQSSKLIEGKLGDLIYHRDGRKICTHVVYSGSKGILAVDGPNRPRVWIRDSEYRSIARRFPCRQVPGEAASRKTSVPNSTSVTK
jgi:hypothetical protein